MGQVAHHDHVEQAGAHERLRAAQVQRLYPLPAVHLEHVDVCLRVHEQMPVTHGCGRGTALNKVKILRISSLLG